MIEKFILDFDHVKRQGRKLDEVCRRLYACDQYEITPSERVILMRANIDYAALVDEVTRLRDKLAAIDNSQYNAEMNIVHIGEELDLYKMAFRLACKEIDSGGKLYFTPGGNPLDHVCYKQAERMIRDAKTAKD